ncbi:hypothetical protein ACP0HM_00640 [Escherichia coli]
MRTLFSQQQWIDMKVLVTGATSGLGRNAVEFLCQKGISVRATGRNEAMGKLLEKNGRRVCSGGSDRAGFITS